MNDYQLVQHLAENTKAQRELTEAMKDLVNVLALQAQAVHALADALAACTSDPVPEPKPSETDAGFDARPMYMDGTPIG